MDEGPWYRWGPYVAERAWGTVREDYSPDGDAWASFPHDHARSRAYRWNEDGMAGISDVRGRLNLALAVWNGRDPILKERMFGLTNDEGNHGEDVKEYWWYLDALPSSAWLRWRYHYPQGAYPYEELVRENARRTQEEREYELIDTGAFDDDRYWIIEVSYAKADPDDILMRIDVRNAGPDAEYLHVLPTLWFRNTWAFQPGTPMPALRADSERSPTRILASHPDLGERELIVGSAPGQGAPELLFCRNETNAQRLYGLEPTTPYPKDGINDHVVNGRATVDSARVGTKAAAWYRLEVPPGGSVELRLRLRPCGPGARDADEALGPAFDRTLAARSREADEFYAGLSRPDASPEETRIMRQAFAGMLWCRQYYAYDVSRWLAGDPGRPAPPEGRRSGRNARWRSLDAADILSMPDSWEYPWFAAWDLAFHAVTLAHVDPAFAKDQLLLLCREWFQRPDGALPAYEWSFDDINPPVHAWAALRVFEIDGTGDTAFLERIFHKLLANFTWWLNNEDREGRDVFGGGFLGLDNIGAFDRSHVPEGGRLEQSDATAWMAFYAISMLRIAYTLAERDRTYDDLVITFLEHTVRIVRAMDESGLWDEEAGFYFDVLRGPDGSRTPMRIHSMVGLIPLLPAAFVPEGIVKRSVGLGKRFARFLVSQGLGQESFERSGSIVSRPGASARLLSIVSTARLRRILGEVLDADAFLSPYGLRALSRRHLDRPFRVAIGGVDHSVDYEPGESRSRVFGGNSNWRGPVWFPLNLLVIESLVHWDDWFGDELRIELPTGSRRHARLVDVARDLAHRLVTLWLPGPDGRRPVHGGYAKLADDPEWRDLLPFHEYFHGDTGAGLGASHQTGWTGLVAHLLVRGGILDRRDPVPPRPPASTAER